MYEKSKSCVKKIEKLVFKTNYCLMQVKSIEGEHSAILLTFIMLQIVIKIFVLSNSSFEIYINAVQCAFSQFITEF